MSYLLMLWLVSGEVAQNWVTADDCAHFAVAINASPADVQIETSDGRKMQATRAECHAVAVCDCEEPVS